MDKLKMAALNLSEALAPAPKNILKVAEEVGEEASRWAFLQWDLRRRAKAKFARADEMLFDREGLEMATPEAVAAYHASQFMRGETVADLTCGIGSDLIALARRGPVIGFEVDEERAEIAQFNLAVHGLDARIVQADSLLPGGELGRGCEGEDIVHGAAGSFDRAQDDVSPYPAGVAHPQFDAAFADPARRGGGRRFVNADEFAPNPNLIAERMRKMRLGGIKLSPMLPDDFLVGFGGRLEFVSFGRECREALVWLGRDSGGGRWAVHVEKGERLMERPLPPSSDKLGRYLFDCDPAAVRAHVIGTLCESFELTPVGDSNGYLTSDEITESPWLRGYRVLWTGKGDRKATQVAISSLGGRIVEVKARGLKETADSVRAKFKAVGERPLILVVWRVGKSLRHAIVEPT